MRDGDRDLARGVLEGDEEAIGLVIRWISQVLTWPRFWSLREERRDLVQESLARVIASLKNGQFDPSKALAPYVQGIARHAALQTLGKTLRQQGRRHVKDEDGDVTLSASDGAPLADAVARQELVRRVMDGASEDCRLLLRLYFLEGKNYEEIGAELVIPVGTVKSRLSRCLDAAQKALRVAVPRASLRPPAAQRREGPSR